MRAIVYQKMPFVTWVSRGLAATTLCPEYFGKAWIESGYAPSVDGSMIAGAYFSRKWREATTSSPAPCLLSSFSGLVPSIEQSVEPGSPEMTVSILVGQFWYLNAISGFARSDYRFQLNNVNYFLSFFIHCFRSLSLCSWVYSGEGARCLGSTVVNGGRFKGNERACNVNA